VLVDEEDAGHGGHWSGLGESAANRQRIEQMIEQIRDRVRNERMIASLSRAWREARKKSC
jgi:hypothetical protein